MGGREQRRGKARGAGWEDGREERREGGEDPHIGTLLGCEIRHPGIKKGGGGRRRKKGLRPPSLPPSLPPGF